MRNRKNSFDEIFDKIDWLMIQPVRNTWRLSPDAVAIGFHPKDKQKPDIINQVRIRIGVSVLQKLKWNYGDKICVLHDPDDLMSFYLTKTENGMGYALSRETDNAAGRIQLMWQRDIPLELRQTKPVKFHIHKGGIVIFRVGSQEEDDE